MAAVPRITGGGLPEIEAGGGDITAPLVVHDALVGDNLRRSGDDGSDGSKDGAGRCTPVGRGGGRSGADPRARASETSNSGKAPNSGEAPNLGEADTGSENGAGGSGREERTGGRTGEATGSGGEGAA